MLAWTSILNALGANNVSDPEDRIMRVLDHWVRKETRRPISWSTIVAVILSFKSPREYALIDKIDKAFLWKNACNFRELHSIVIFKNIYIVILTMFSYIVTHNYSRLIVYIAYQSSCSLWQFILLLILYAFRLAWLQKSYVYRLFWTIWRHEPRVYFQKMLMKVWFLMYMHAHCLHGCAKDTDLNHRM